MERARLLLALSNKKMKATGIVRRIDDLGRVVIPKEIRRNMNIREGDPLEIFIEDGGVVFKKYSLLSSFAPQAAHIQKVLSINGISASVLIIQVFCAVLAPSECQRPRTNGSIFVIGVLNGRESRCLLLLLSQKVR